MGACARVPPSAGIATRDSIPSFPATAAFLVAANVALLSAIFASQTSYFLPTTIAYFTFVALLVTGVELLLLGACWRRLVRHRALAAFVVGFVCAANLRYFLVPVLLSADPAVKLSLQAAAFAGGFLFVWLPVARTPAFVFLFLFVLQSWLFSGLGDSARSRDTLPADASTADAQVANLARANRNIYVLMFDALISDDAFAELFKRHSRLPELPWKPVLVAEGMADYPSAISPSYLSQPSFYRLLSLGVETHPEFQVPRRFFGGEFPIPAYEVARAAGMRSQFLSTSSYFGVKSGPNVDYFFPERVTGLCAFVAVEFLGIACRPWMLDLAARLGIEHRIPTDYAEDAQQEAGLLQQIERRARSIQDSTTRWVTIAYLWTPGHVTPEHDYRREVDVKSYVNTFDREAAETARIASALVRTIKRVDPSSVIVVAGDHGARITQRADDVLPARLLELDWRGVGFFVYPQSECAQVFGVPGYDLGFLLHDLYSCIGPRS